MSNKLCEFCRAKTSNELDIEYDLVFCSSKCKVSYEYALEDYRDLIEGADDHF